MKKALALLMFAITAIFAQEPTPTVPATPPVAPAPAAPAPVQAPAPETPAPEQAVAAPEAAAADSAAAAMGSTAAAIEPQAAADSTQAADSTVAAVADSAAAAEPVPEQPAPPPEPAPEPVQEAAPVPAIAEQPLQLRQTAISFGLGIRAGAGISNFRKHVALNAIKVADGKFAALKLEPALAASAGLAAQIGISSIFSAAPELMYSLYRSNNEAEGKNKGEFNNVYEAGVYMHALELPVLARFHFAERFVYAEAGPQIGLNLYSRIYKNADYYRPDMNLLAFGAAAGAGINFNGTAMGIRGYFGFLEYAKDAKGIPWNVQLSISHFIF